ncbi:hypothetical protein ACP70R_000191 [Stipagrostis hirtigluma subsp. patula]
MLSARSATEPSTSAPGDLGIRIDLDARVVPRRSHHHLRRLRRLRIVAGGTDLLQLPASTSSSSSHMSDLVKREFDVLAPNGPNYLAWSLDTEILFASKDLLRMIKPKDDKDKSTPAEQVMALHILRHHLSTTLKNEYMTVTPQVSLTRCII